MKHIAITIIAPLIMNDLRKALSDLLNAAEVYEADQSVSTDKRVGMVQPITVEEGLALNEALDNARNILIECVRQDAYDKKRDEFLKDVVDQIDGFLGE